jgi:hypothetical protein
MGGEMLLADEINYLQSAELLRMDTTRGAEI